MTNQDFSVTIAPLDSGEWGCEIGGAIMRSTGEVESTPHKTDKTINRQKKDYTKKEIMLSLVEVLYNSNNINETTYIEVKRAIKREVK